MADTVFVNGVTLTDSDWMNDVNRLHYTIFADPANLGAVRTTLAASDTLAGTIEYAVQSEMETGTSNTLAVTPGRQHYHPSAAKAWVNCGVTGNVLASYNVTSVTDTGTGEATVNYTTSFSSTNYVIVASVQAGSVLVSYASPATGSVLLRAFSDVGAAIDPTAYSAAMFGDQ